MKNLIWVLLIGLWSCELEEPKPIVPPAPKFDFTFTLDSALYQNGKLSLPKDKNGYYHIKLFEQSWQTFSRITGRFLWNGKPNPIPSPVDVRIEWTSTHTWELAAGSGIFNVYKSYFNTYNGQFTTSLIGTFKAQDSYIVPTVNRESYPNTQDGAINTIFAPVLPMRGDTIVVTATAHIVKEIPTSINFSRLEKEKIVRKISFITY